MTNKIKIIHRNKLCTSNKPLYNNNAIQKIFKRKSTKFGKRDHRYSYILRIYYIALSADADTYQWTKDDESINRAVFAVISAKAEISNNETVGALQATPLSCPCRHFDRREKSLPPHPPTSGFSQISSFMLLLQITA